MDFAIYNLSEFDYYCDWSQLEPTFFASQPTYSGAKPVEKTTDGRSSKNKISTSVYTYFFRTQLPKVRVDMPNCTFGEYSKIIAAMWEELSDKEKKELKNLCAKLRRDQMRETVMARVLRVRNGTTKDVSPKKTDKIPVLQERCPNTA